MDTGNPDYAPRVSLGFGGQPERGGAENRRVAPGATGTRGYGVPLSGSLRPRLSGAGRTGGGQRSPRESCPGTHTWDY